MKTSVLEKVDALQLTRFICWLLNDGISARQFKESGNPFAEVNLNQNGGMLPMESDEQQCDAIIGGSYFFGGFK